MGASLTRPGWAAQSAHKTRDKWLAMLLSDSTSIAFFLSGNDYAAFNVMMSFGHSIGVFITILQPANKISERFIDALEHKAISGE
jgi:hypothetical protein